MSHHKHLTRRRVLGGLSLLTGSIAVGDFVLSPTVAGAAASELSEAPLVIFVYFGGGWDTLLSIDPRDDDVFGIGDPNYPAIDTGLTHIEAQNPVFKALTQQYPGGVVQPSGSNIDFGLGCGELINRYEDLCVIRGVDMGTLTHEVGRRYFITGKFPRGVLPSGSGLPTWVASQDPSLASIPNLVVGGMESFNEGLDPKATGLGVQGYEDLAVVLKPIDEMLKTPAAMEQAVARHLSENHCLHRQLDTEGIVEAYRAGWEKSLLVGGGSLYEPFNFVSNPAANSQLDVLYDTFGINKSSPFNELAGPKGRAMVAAQALTNDLCQAVSVRIVPDLDTHQDNWVSDHWPRLRDAFDAVAALLDHLTTTTDSNGKPYIERTTVVMFSEFTRTPLLNVQRGRDHHLANSCILAGAGIKGNQVIGATTTDSFELTSFDFETSTSKGVNDGSPALRPADIHATALAAMGVSYDHISNQDPQVIEGALS